MPAKLSVTPHCSDPFDLPFLQLAVAGKAEYLVSGDQDLLSLNGLFACTIITADQFMKTLNNDYPRHRRQTLEPLQRPQGRRHHLSSVRLSP
jgi:hypothetical protein